jgi:hypothetical protein
MKHITKTLSTILVIFIIFSCNENDNPAPGLIPEDKAIALAIDEMIENTAILADLLDETSSVIEDSVKRIKAKSKTKTAFINNMDILTKDVFKNVIAQHQQKLQLSTTPQPFSGEAEITLKSIVSSAGAAAASPSDINDDYSKAIAALIESSSKAGVDSRRVLKSYRMNDGNTRQLSAENTDLSAEQLKSLAGNLYKTIESDEYTETKRMEEIGKIINRYDLPPVAIALLLPAVQKAQEAAGTAKDETNLAIYNWIDNTIPQPIQGALDRDLIRRKAYALTFLAGLHMLASDNYQNTSQHDASLSILHARYRATLLLTWDELWKLD